MALRREVDHHVRLLLLKQRVDRLPIGNVAAHEAELLALHRLLKRGQVARVGQLVQADHTILWVVL